MNYSIVEQFSEDPKSDVSQSAQILCENEGLFSLIADPEMLGYYPKGTPILGDDVDTPALENDLVFLETPKGKRAVLIGAKLSNGGNALVYHAYDLEDGAHIVLKKLFIDDAKDKKAELDNEHKALLHFDRARGVAICGNQLFIGQDFVPGKTFSDYIHEFIDDFKPSTSRETKTARYAEGVYAIRAFLNVTASFHAAGFIHRDLKPANAIIDSRGDICLIDFGSSNQKKELLPSHLGTPKYMAPEIKDAEDEDACPFTQASDVFAIGESLQELYDVLSGGAFLRQSKMILKQEHLALGELIFEMTARDPEERPSMSQALSTLEDIIKVSPSLSLKSDVAKRAMHPVQSSARYSQAMFSLRDETLTATRATQDLALTHPAKFQDDSAKRAVRCDMN